MCKEVENQSDFDEKMKQAEKLFRKLEKLDFVEDTIEIKGAPDKTKKLQEEYRKQNIYKKWMLYKAGELLTKNSNANKIELKKDISEAFTKIGEYFGENEEEKELIVELCDPDGKISNGKVRGSRLLQYIYKKLWSELTEQDFMRYPLKKCLWICSDTMTSGQQKLNNFLELANVSDFEKTRIEIEKKIGTTQKYSTKLYIELYVRHPEDFGESICGGKNTDEDTENIKSIETQLREFLKHLHQLGNYCPVPIGFNRPRSGSYADHDYWDLTLRKIQEYYLNPDDAWKILGEELLHGSGNALACKLWLDYFGSWKEFIKQNYMQDFVKDFEHGNYEVEPFFDRRNWNKLKPEKLDEFKELFEKSSKMIKKRTERIVNALIAEYKQEQLLNGIMVKLKTIGTKEE